MTVGKTYFVTYLSDNNVKSIGTIWLSSDVFNAVTFDSSPPDGE